MLGPLFLVVGRETGGELLGAPLLHALAVPPPFPARVGTVRLKMERSISVRSVGGGGRSAVAAFFSSPGPHALPAGAPDLPPKRPLRAHWGRKLCIFDFAPSAGAAAESLVAIGVHACRCLRLWLPRIDVVKGECVLACS